MAEGTITLDVYEYRYDIFTASAGDRVDIKMNGAPKVQHLIHYLFLLGCRR